MGNIEKTIKEKIQKNIADVSLWELLTGLRANCYEFLNELTAYFDLVVVNNPDIIGHQLIIKTKKNDETILKAHEDYWFINFTTAISDFVSAKWTGCAY